MKRPLSPDTLPADPVLAQLDWLINGGDGGGSGNTPTISIDAPPPSLPAPDPILSQLDALINPGSASSAAPPLALTTPVALVLPPQPPPPAIAEAPPPLLALSSQPAAATPVCRRHAGVLREEGGVLAWMASRLALAEP